MIYWVGVWQDPEDWMTGIHLSRDFIGCFMSAAIEFFTAESSSTRIRGEWLNVPNNM